MNQETKEKYLYPTLVKMIIIFFAVATVFLFYRFDEARALAARLVKILEPFLYGAVIGTVSGNTVEASLPEVAARKNDNTFYEVPEIPDFAAEQKILCVEKGLFSVLLRVSAGSADNIKPELVMEAFARFLSCEAVEELKFRIHRLDMYTGENPGLKRL